MTPIPQSIEHYELRGLLGSDGMGEVYRAYDQRLDREVAIKLIHRKKIGDREAESRFLREARTMARIRNPWIVQIHELVDTEDSHAIVMELIEGETISDYLRRERPEPQHLLRLLWEIAEGLAAAHAQGVVHRDLKAENVMITATGVKILDFGLAKNLTSTEVSVTADDSVVGTLYCMSPEQIQGSAVDHRSDLFSFGVLCYLALTGEKPFAGSTVPEILTRIIHNPHTSVSERMPAVTPELSELIDRLLAKDPKQRPQSAEEVADNLARQAGLPIPSRKRARRFRWPFRRRGSIDSQATTWPDERPWVRRVQRLVPTAAAVAAVVVLLILQPWIGEPPAVAVLDLANVTAESEANWPGMAIAEILTANMRANGELRAVSRERIAEVKKDLAPFGGERLTAEDLERLRPHLTADAVAVGSYELVEDGGARLLRFHLLLQDPKTGAMRWERSVEGPQEELFALVDQAAEQLRRELGADPLSAVEKEQVRSSFPADAEAARLYFAGLDQLRRLRPGDAIKVLDQAVAKEPEHPHLLTVMAAAWRELGDPWQAQAVAQQASQLGEGMPRRERLEIEARYHEIARDWVEAARVYDELFRDFPDVDYGLRLVEIEVAAGAYVEALADIAGLRELPLSVRSEARLDLAVANVHYARRELEPAKTLAEQAAATAERLGATYLAARARFTQGKSLDELHDSSASLAVLVQARLGFEKARYQPGVDEAFHLTAVIHAKRDELTEARELLQIYLNGYRNGPGPLYAVSNLCNVLVNLGLITTGKILLEDALAALDDLSEDQQAVAESNLGTTFHALGELIEARLHYEAALQIFKDLGDDFSAAMAMTNVAEVLFLQGQLDEALALHQQVLEINRTFEGNDEGIAYDHFRLGKVLCARGDLAAAADHYAHAMELWRGIEDLRGIAQTQAAQAELEYNQYDFNDAARLADEAQTTLWELELPDLAVPAQVVRGHALLKQGRVDEALKLSQRSSSHAAKSESRLVGLVAGILAARLAAESESSDEVEEALAALREAGDEAARSGFVAQAFEARLIMGEIEIRAERTKAAGRRRLAELAGDAGVQGFGGVVQRVERMPGR